MSSKTNRNRRYSNDDITVVWQSTECIHAGICFRELRRVFDPVKRPWVNIEGAPSADIIAIIERCPTQALTFMWNDPARNVADSSSKIFRGDLSELFPEDSSLKSENTEAINQPAPVVAKAVIRPGGPLVIEGDFTITYDGNPLKTMKMSSICRCGMSGDMPFCDGAHFKAGFRK